MVCLFGENCNGWRVDCTFMFIGVPHAQGRECDGGRTVQDLANQWALRRGMADSTHKPPKGHWEVGNSECRDLSSKSSMDCLKMPQREMTTRLKTMNCCCLRSRWWHWKTSPIRATATGVSPTRYPKNFLPCLHRRGIFNHPFSFPFVLPLLNFGYSDSNTFFVNSCSWLIQCCYVRSLGLC